MIARQQIVRLAMILTVVLVLATGCASPGSQETAPEEAAPEEAAPEEAAPEEAVEEEAVQEEITLQVQHSIFPEEARALMEEYAAAFEEENPNINIEISYVPWENHRTATLSKIASGNAPDILHSNSNQGSVEFDTLGAFVDLEGLMDADFRAQFIPTAFEEIGADGLPYVQSPETAIFYRTDMFEEAGIEPPPVEEAWTWDEMIEAAKALTKDTDGDGEIDQWGFGERGKAGFIFMKSTIPYVWSFGSDIIVQEDGEWVSGIKTPGTQEAIETNVELATVHQVRPMSYLSEGFPEAIRAWCEGQTAMINIGMWWASAVEENCEDQEILEDFDAMLFPVNEPSNKFVYTAFDYFHITKQSEHPEAAFEFLQFLFESERLRALAQATFNLPPTIVSALEDEAYSGENYPLWAERFGQWQELGKFIPLHPEYNALWVTVVQPVVQSIVQGRITLEEGLEELDQRVTFELTN